MSGRTSFALAWAPGLARSPAPSSNIFGICEARLTDAGIHARHGYGELCSPWPRTGRGTFARLSAVAALHQHHHSRGITLRRRSETIPEASRLISTFAEAVAVVPFDQPAADHFAAVAASLTRRGGPIGTFDTLMAAHALSLGVTFVTNNTKHFGRVVGLKTENWA